jgi:hypothetical protein
VVGLGDAIAVGVRVRLGCATGRRVAEGLGAWVAARGAVGGMVGSVTGVIKTTASTLSPIKMRAMSSARMTTIVNNMASTKSNRRLCMVMCNQSACLCETSTEASKFFTA